MTTSRPALRVIAVALLLLTLLSPAALAVELPYHEELVFDDTLSESYMVPVSGDATAYNGALGFRVADVTKFKNPKIIFIGDAPVTMVTNPDVQSSGSAPVNIAYADVYLNTENVGEGRLCYNTHYIGGVPSRVQIWLEITKWNTNYVTAGSATYITQPHYTNLGIGLKQPEKLAPGNATDKLIVGMLTQGSSQRVFPGNHIVEYGRHWESAYTVSQTNNETYNVFVDRKNYYSNVSISDNTATYYDSYGIINVSKDVFNYTLNRPLNLQIIDPYGNVYLRNLLDDPIVEPTPTIPSTVTNYSVTVYVKNSQTGAAIANSNVVIDALVNGEYYPVANTTEPSGIFSITLQPTGGGQPNPDSYRLIATADGYNNPMPEINFTVTDSKKYIYCYLDPIAGGPENENNTFIDFYVRDLSANPVSGATVKFGKYTLITNSHGYTVFEVPKNTDYTYTVSKSGYGPVTGNANIGANDRYIINAVIGPAVTPTAPTAIPTDTPTGPTPTLTAPTGEPVNNLLEWFAAHFGMILGGGVEIGKIFMWLCFTVPVGVYIGKEAKSGAAGFMAGAGIVTLFFVIIGWVPIWIVVLLALIIGLLYAKVFNNSDTGGGR